ITPACESSRASRAATSLLYRVALRDPTIATAGRRSFSRRPIAKRRNGGSAISDRSFGYSSSKAVTTLTPDDSTAPAHRSEVVSSGPARTARARSTDPSRSPSSPSGVDRTASSPPGSRAGGHTRWGVSSRDRAQEIAVRRARGIRNIFSSTRPGARKDGPGSHLQGAGRNTRFHGFFRKREVATTSRPAAAGESAKFRERAP